jgi:AcrR family transcriptional regulator
MFVDFTSNDSLLSTPISQAPERRPRRRQARGERRIAQLLDAAAEVFGEVGYEAATTNAIAARAGLSPGSLYQFFPHKEAVAESLAERYLKEFEAIQETAFAPDVASLPLDVLLDRVVDPLISFNVANPGFRALFTWPVAPPRLAGSARRLHSAVLQRVEALLASIAPEVPADRRLRCAMVTVQVVKALLPLVLSASPVEREELVEELKTVIRAYLSPLSSEAG